MQVSQQSDSVTHAVIGKKDSVEMGVSDSAALMHIFSTTLYTYPKLATVREIICNGWDGHITSDRTDKPLEITIDNEKIVIRDFGPGIPHDKIGPIYGVFGNSTKREDGSVTGGFGLGSKAPFSYTDNFEVVSNHEGVKSVYRVSKSSMAVGGKPSIDLMVQIPTEETGIRVTIPLKSSWDKDAFMGHILEVLVLGGIYANVNGQPVEYLPIHETPTGYLISSFKGTLTNKINLRYGNVVYPIPRMEHYGEMWDQVEQNMRKLWSGANIVFLAAPDTISIAPSREALIFTDGTVETIKQLMAKFNPQDATTSKVMTRQINAAVVNKTVRAEPGATRAQDLATDIQMPVIKTATMEHATGPYAFKLRKAAIAFAISQRSLVVKGEDLVLKRAHHMVNTTPGIDKVLGKKLLRACRLYEAARKGKEKDSWHSRHKVLDHILQAPLMRWVTSPLLAMIRANEFMDVQMLSYVDQVYRYDSNLKYANPVKYVVGSTQALMGFVFKRILLARSKTAIKEFFDGRRYQQGELFQEGWAVYQLPKSDKNYDEIRKSFEELGYEVHTYLPVRSRTVQEPSQTTSVIPAERKPSVKRKGYLTLDSSWDGSEFKLSVARSNCKPEEHTFDPIAYVVLGGNSCISNISKQASRYTADMWGKQIAVITSSQEAKFIEKGIPEVDKFVHEYVEKSLMAAPDFRRYLAFGQHFNHGNSYGRSEGISGVVRNMLLHTELIDSFPFRFRYSMTVETEMLVRFFEDNSYNGSRKKLKKCQELAEKVQKSPMVAQVRKTISDSGWTRYLDLDEIGNALRNCVPGDEQLAVPYLIMREIFKEGIAP